MALAYLQAPARSRDLTLAAMKAESGRPPNNALNIAYLLDYFQKEFL